MVRLSKKEKEFIINKWRDIEFIGSFSGLSTFLLSLRHKYPEKKYKFSDIETVLKEDPVYLAHLQMPKKIIRRTVNYSEMAPRVSYHADLFEMPPFDNKKFGLLVVDQMTNMIYTRSQETKSADETFRCFMDIFSSNDLLKTLHYFSVDKGAVTRAIIILKFVGLIRRSICFQIVNRV